MVNHSYILHRCITADNQGLYMIFLVLSNLVSVIFFSVLVTQTDTPLTYRENWWKLLPLIVGHYVLDVINVIQFRKVCLKMPCRRLWRRQITTGSCRIF